MGHSLVERNVFKQLEPREENTHSHSAVELSLPKSEQFEVCIFVRLAEREENLIIFITEKIHEKSRETLIKIFENNS